MNDTTPLIPVADWVWDLYVVKFWADGAVLVGKKYLVSSCENHIKADCNEAAPVSCAYFTWERIKENVAAPRSVGHMYGRSVSESGWETGARMAADL